MSADFEVYADGLFCLSVCSSLDREDVVRRADVEDPTGLDHGWEIAPEPFRDGTPNGCPCQQRPDTHRHWLLSC